MVAWPAQEFHKFYLEDEYFVLIEHIIRTHNWLFILIARTVFVLFAVKLTSKSS